MATRYTELALDGANLYIVNRIKENLKVLNKTEEEATKELYLTAFKDYSNLDDSLDEIDKKLTSNNGITMLGIMKKSFNINFISALNKTLDKLGYKNSALDILKDASVDKNFSSINTEQINSLMNYWNLKNDRYDNDDFDGGNFSNNFDTRLDDIGYVRLCVKTENSIKSMIIVEKNKLDVLIQSNFNKNKLLEADSNYANKKHEFYDDFLEAYYEVYEPIIKQLGIDIKYYDQKNNFSMYVDGIDYILSESEKLGYKFNSYSAQNDESPLNAIIKEYEASQNDTVTIVAVNSKEDIKKRVSESVFNKLEIKELENETIISHPIKMLSRHGYDESYELKSLILKNRTLEDALKNLDLKNDSGLDLKADFEKNYKAFLDMHKDSDYMYLENQQTVDNNIVFGLMRKNNLHKCDYSKAIVTEVEDLGNGYNKKRINKQK